MRGPVPHTLTWRAPIRDLRALWSSLVPLVLFIFSILAPPGGAVAEVNSQGAGVLLVKISTVLNPEGRDAAGACCAGPGKVSQGQCQGPCFTMLRVCATEASQNSRWAATLSNLGSYQVAPVADTSGHLVAPPSPPAATVNRRKTAAATEVVLGRPLKDRRPAGVSAQPGISPRPAINSRPGAGANTRPGAGASLSPRPG